ncbi:MAG: hypothetical protein ACRDPC_09620 [Solirubrobacteraceae bacterium]
MRDRYGLGVAELQLRLIEIPLRELDAFAVEDLPEFFEALIEEDRSYERAMLLHSEPVEAWNDAEERLFIVRDYIAQFRDHGAERVAPVLVDARRLGDLAMIDLIDGHHRVIAAHEAGVGSIRAWEVLSADARAARVS